MIFGGLFPWDYIIKLYKVSQKLANFIKLGIVAN